MKYVNIIHDSRRSEKYPLLMAELKRQGLTEKDVEIWPAMLLDTVVESINASHRMIVQKAKDEEMESVLIMEDDVLFPAEDGFRYFLDHLPDFPCRMYLAGAYSVTWHDSTRKRIVTHFVGMHCYIIPHWFYDIFLEIPKTVHIDTYISDMIAKYEIAVYCCYPMAAIQRKGWSANNGKDVDYNYLLKPEDVRGGLP